MMAREDTKIICVDILNQFGYRGQDKDKPFDQKSAVEDVIEKINNFVVASKRSNYKIIGFIDKAIETEETYRKWSDKRIREIKDRKKRNQLVNTPLLLGEEFKKLGIEVHYSTIDCDDTIAAFAYHLKGSVLSQDTDFLRYFKDSDSGKTTTSNQNGPFKVSSSYKIDREGFLRLTEQKRIKILEELPKTEDTACCLTAIPDFMTGEAGKAKLMFRRGCGSTLTALTNPHIQVSLTLKIH